MASVVPCLRISAMPTALPPDGGLRLIWATSLALDLPVVEVVEPVLLVVAVVGLVAVVGVVGVEVWAAVVGVFLLLPPLSTSDTMMTSTITAAASKTIL